MACHVYCPRTEAPTPPRVQTLGCYVSTTTPQFVLGTGMNHNIMNFETSRLPIDV